MPAAAAKSRKAVVALRRAGAAALLTAVLPALLACGGSGAGDTPVGDTPVAGQGAAPAGAPSPTPDRTGAADDTVPAQVITWDLAALEAALRGAGLEPARAAAVVSHPFMSVAGTVYSLSGGGELQAFLYADANAAARDVERLDTARVAPPTMMITWRATPALVTSNNLAAIVLTNDAALRRRVREALAARRHANPS